MNTVHLRKFTALIAVALLACACATRAPVPADAAKPPAAQSVLRSLATERAVEDRILALDPELLRQLFRRQMVRHIRSFRRAQKSPSARGRAG